MTEQAKREMTLDEICARLDGDHLANKQLAALKAENAELREALGNVSAWLHAAINNPDWHWDADQRGIAEGCIAEAKRLNAKHKERG